MLGGRMHRVDYSLVLAEQQIVQNLAADLARLGGGADHGDRFRMKNRIQRGDAKILLAI